MPKVLLVGNYPPPYGGISTHVMRLGDVLASGDYRVEIVDLYNRIRLPEDPLYVHRLGGKVGVGVLRGIQHVRRSRADVVHFHVTFLKSFELIGGFLLLGMPRQAKLMMTIHGGKFADFVRHARPFRRKRLARLLSRFDRLVVVNSDASDALVEMGIKSDKVCIIPAFLPSQRPGASSVVHPVRELQDQGFATALVCGSALPYYGFHVLLDALERLSSSRRVVPVVAFYGREDLEYRRLIERKLQGAGVPYCVFRDLNPPDFASLVSAVDMFVRPTDRDGDSVALREAAQYGKQCIASDCAPRPPGCLLFKTMDAASLADAIDTALRDPTQGRIVFDPLEYQRQTLDLYAHVLDPVESLLP